MINEGDLIAKRTRSQLPLQDVPIESIEGNENLVLTETNSLVHLKRLMVICGCF